MKRADRKIAFESRLKGCSNVITLGVKPNFTDYNEEETALIKRADTIYYPTDFYADLFDSITKRTFPSYQTYRFAQDKIKQTALFNLSGIPHPRTRVFYGKQQKSKICEYFNYPFIGKNPTGSAMGRGVFLIKNKQDLEEYLSCVKVAYIQEYLPIDRDIRVVVIGTRVVHAYWRIAASGEFRTNIAMGAKISLDPVPEQALELARHIAYNCRLNDVGIDIMYYKDKPYVLEANMKYGKEGFRKAGIDYLKLMEKMIKEEEI